MARPALEQPDPREMIRLIAQNTTVVRQRIAGIAQVIEAAAAVDSEIADLVARMGGEFYANQRAVVERLARRGQLRDGLSTEAAADILWTLNSGKLYTMLVHERGWAPERYERWLVGLLQRELLA